MLAQFPRRRPTPSACLTQCEKSEAMPRSTFTRTLFYVRLCYFFLCRHNFWSLFNIPTERTLDHSSQHKIKIRKLISPFVLDCLLSQLVWLSSVFVSLPFISSSLDSPPSRLLSLERLEPTRDFCWFSADSSFPPSRNDSHFHRRKSFSFAFTIFRWTKPQKI